MTRTAFALAAFVILALLAGSVDSAPPAEYHIYLPEAYRAPYAVVPTVVCKASCDEPPAITTATKPVPTLVPPAISITRTPTP